jgi:hypothetical protein
MEELTRCQEKAAELVLEDEAWRGDLTDDAAAPLLDWALRRTDAALQAHASGGTEAAASLADTAYAVANQARAILATIARAQASGSEEQMWQDLQPHLGPPLFGSPEEGRTVVNEALVSAGLATEEAASDPSSRPEDGAPEQPPDDESEPSPADSDAPHHGSGDEVGYSLPDSEGTAPGERAGRDVPKAGKEGDFDGRADWD